MNTLIIHALSPEYKTETTTCVIHSLFRTSGTSNNDGNVLWVLLVMFLKVHLHTTFFDIVLIPKKIAYIL